MLGDPSPTALQPKDVSGTNRIRVWRLQYGPCWCRGEPSSSGPFDFMRMAKTPAVEGDADWNLVLVSDRVFEGARAMVLGLLADIPIPRVVISTAACPATRRFWESLPEGWITIEDLIPVDIRVKECVSASPEALLGETLGHLLRISAAPGGRTSVRGQLVGESAP